LSAQAANMNTLSGSWQALKNEMLLSFGAIEKSTGFFDRLAISTNQLAQGIGIIREFFKGDDIKSLTDELKTATDRLVAYDKTDPLTQRIVGGPEAREKMIADMKRLSAELRQLTAPAKKAPASLETKAVVDKSFQDELAKDYEKQLADRKSAALKSAQQVAKTERDLSLAESAWRAKQANTYQDDLRKRWEKSELEKQKMADQLAKDDYEQKQKYLEFLSKQAEENYNSAQDLIKKQAEEVERQYERTQDILTREILNSLNRGFGDEGLSIAENFFKSLKNMAQSVVLEPAIRFILNESGITSIAATVASMFSGQSSGAGSIPSTQGASVFDRISDGFKSINTTFAGSIENLGVFLSNGQGGLADQIGGFMGQYSSQISSALGYAGAAYAGYNMIKEDNYAGAILTGIGAYFGGPAGAAIGAYLGGMLAKVKTQKSSAGATGSYIDGKFTGNGLTGLAGYGINAGGQDALTAGLEAYSKTFGSLLERFDLNSNITTSASVFQRNSKKERGWGYFDAAFEGGSVNFATGHVGSAANAVSSIIDWILNTGMVESIQKSKLPEGVRMLFDGLADKAQVGNMITATMSLADAQEALLNRYNLTADSAGKVSVATGLAADDLAKFVTTLANTAFTSQKASEQLIQQRDKLNELLTDAGGDSSINANLTAFDDFLKSIDTQSAEGQKRFADLFSLRGSVGAMQTAWDELMGNVGASVYGLLSPAEQLKKDQEALNKLFAEYGLQVPQTADELAKLGQTIQQNFNAADEASIDLALAFPTLVAAFMGAKDKLIEGGREMSSFTSLADFRAYKGVLNNYGASIANDYAGVRGIVGNNADGVTVLNNTQIDMLEVLKEMRKATEEARTASRETAEALRNIQVRGLKVAS